MYSTLTITFANSGAGRVRREARALGLMSDDPTRVGDGIARLTSMGRGVRLRSAGSGRSVALTACAECGTNPAKVSVSYDSCSATFSSEEN